jgi:hypothetical protein
MTKPKLITQVVKNVDHTHDIGRCRRKIEQSLQKFGVRQKFPSTDYTLAPTMCVVLFHDCVAVGKHGLEEAGGMSC